MKAISYSLFGYDRARHKDCFDFNSYLRGLHICIRFNRILYPEWVNVLNIDSNTYNSPYKPIFDWHVSKGWLKLNICPDNEPLCKAMLWRLKTVFSYVHPNWEYTHVICRDLDSISTYRESQMVEQWVREDKTIHCITDSVSHTIPMMGGLVGFRPGYLNDRLQLASRSLEKIWDNLIALAPDIDFKRKGSDQDFMNRVIYPKCSDHATEHFIKGMPHNLIEGNGRHYLVDKDITILVDPKFEETNLLAGHAGAAGFYEAPTMKFLHYSDPFMNEYQELESMPEFAQIFYWNTREDLK
jgi:hypothetical protein